MQLRESINAFYKYLFIKCYIVIFLYKNKQINNLESIHSNSYIL